MELLRRLKDAKLFSFVRAHFALITKYIVYFSLARSAKKKSILVYTMGKVGSTTIRQASGRELKDYSIYHVHWLNEKHLKKDEVFHAQFHRRNRKRGVKTDFLPSHIIRGFYLRKKIENGAEQEPWKIITLTRDPVARNVSSFFQNLKKFFSYDIGQRLGDQTEDNIVEELTSLFINEYIKKNSINFLDADPLTWFDEELKKVFGIDVYQQAFPKEKGYEIYNRDKVSVLLIRLENLNDCFVEAIKEFLGKEISVVKAHNASKNKEYAAVYTQFKETIQIPNWYLDKMYSSKYARHFYSDQEILNFWMKWDPKIAVKLNKDENNEFTQELVRG